MTSLLRPREEFKGHSQSKASSIILARVRSRRKRGLLKEAKTGANPKVYVRRKKEYET